MEPGPYSSEKPFHFSTMVSSASSQLMRSNSPLPRSPTRFMGYCRRLEL